MFGVDCHPFRYAGVYVWSLWTESLVGGLYCILYFYIPGVSIEGFMECWCFFLVIDSRYILFHYC